VQKSATYIVESVSSGVNVSPLPHCRKKQRGQDFSCPKPTLVNSLAANRTNCIDLGALELVGIIDVNGSSTRV